MTKQGLNGLRGVTLGWMTGVALMTFVSGLGADAGGAVEASAENSKAGWTSWLPKGELEAGAAVGVGIGMDIFGSVEAHDLALTKIHFGWELDRVYCADSWFQGQIGLFNEFIAGGQYDPEGAYLLGLSPIIQYRLTRWGAVQPFIEGGGGIMATDIGAPDLGSVFEFYQQMGVGLLWRQSDRFAVTTQVRFAHISNASLKDPNRGVNELLVFVGGSWKF